MHLQEPVDLLHRGAGTLGDADLALGVDDRRALALLGRHRTDHRVEVDQRLVVGAAIGHRRLRLLEARQHARQRAKAAHAAHLVQLRAQVVHVELTLGHLLGQLVGFLGVDRLGRLFNQRHDVAHTQDALGDARGVERLDRVQLLARARKLDRTARDRAHRQRRAAARVAVHARQHHAGQRHLGGEAGRDIDRILAGQRIDDQQDFGRRGDIGHRLHLVHQRLIDMQATGGVEHDDVEALQLGRLQRALGDVDRLLARDDRQRRDIGLGAKHRQLFLCRRALDVERRHQHLLAVLFLQPLCDLGGGGGLARPLQADHHDDGGRGHVDHQVAGFRAQHVGQRVGHDLDDHLPRRDRSQHVAAHRPLGRLVDELAHDGQRHVGFQQRDSYLAHRGADIVLRQRTAPTQLVEDPT